ncbi:signal peptidase I [Phycicoccus sp. M110.8]|uniref:signal peptidase I n=1 Tax=Phycicoccus sp. M110.8 TaxID=3075433 RepID=UPI0028FDB0CA|nr:signal peptidase I [Phycicoccus sp. M110.8]MDU0314553.1 signal peptidase I [Phycicoccus sp. M110.8]HET8768985.1 signal peptidase I [Pedococcus sp.]
MNPEPEPLQQDPAAASAPSDAAASSGRAARGPSWLLLVGIALVVMVLVRGFLVQSFFVPSGSMEPTIEPGDRILVNKLVGGSSLQRGDVVVFDGTSTFAAADRTPHQDDGLIGRTLASAARLVGVDVGEQDFVKRVVGLPGDRVVCCDDNGRLTVNGVAVTEPYLYPGDKPSELTFDVTVPRGRLWVMGDHRGDSADSRAHLGDPGGGTVSTDDVIGRAVATYWPLSRLGTFPAPSSLARVPRGSTR